MAKSFNHKLLNNNLGQSVVEYILLLAVITSLGYTVFNNKKYKDFMKGKNGMFATMKNGIAYSYRYGVEYNNGIDISEKMEFDYKTNKHDTYLDPKNPTKSRFFGGDDAYPVGPP